MPDGYLWARVDRGDRGSVIKVRGELDAVSANGLAGQVVRLLRRVDGPVTVDLSSLDFVDGAGARTLAAVLGTIPASRLVNVSGIPPRVGRVLDLVGAALPGRAPAPGPGRVHALSLRGEVILAEADTARWQSRALMLESSAVMARLATTYAEIGALRERRGAQQRAKAEQLRARAEQLRALSAAARDLAARSRQRALASDVQPWATAGQPGASAPASRG
ncbi:MAG: STAS domain-containing protein [Actinobacteria bacterium]|nr:STAS domain-containing protein [Actinomycetota bacterium]